MGRQLVPATMVVAIVAFAIAAATAGTIPYRPGSWPAAVSLAILGGVTLMIYAVNVHIVPVFARRVWPSERWLWFQIGLAAAGAWTTYAGHLAGRGVIITIGSTLALVGAVFFAVNLIGLFRQPITAPTPPLPFPAQTTVDVLGTRFMQVAVTYLLLGLLVGVMMSLSWPGSGRWDLVWTHALLVGFFLSMAAGVSYHVLSRWTGLRWRSVTPIRLHLLLVAVGLPIMLAALATDQTALFAVAGPLQMAGIVLYLINIAPFIPGLPGLTRPAIGIAALFLLVGASLGAAFAVDPVLGAQWRLVHAEINLFGWTGLLISGVGYYLVPRFAGQPLRWPRLATAQLAVLAGGVVLGALVWLRRAEGHGEPWHALIAQSLVALGFLLLGATVAGTFLRRHAMTTAALPLTPRPRRA